MKVRGRKRNEEKDGEKEWKKERERETKKRTERKNEWKRGEKEWVLIDEDHIGFPRRATRSLMITFIYLSIEFINSNHSRWKTDGRQYFTERKRERNRERERKNEFGSIARWHRTDFWHDNMHTFIYLYHPLRRRRHIRMLTEALLMKEWKKGTQECA